MTYKMLFAMAAFLLILGFVTFIACGDDDDDDDDNDAAEDDDDTVDDDDTGDDDDAGDDDDTTGGDVCKEGDVVAPDPGMTADSLCTNCHNGSIASVAHEGLYDGGAPDTCMAAGCHACP